MGAAVGKKKGAIAGINITPLVDVVLVLLIIFMVMIKPEPTSIEDAIPKQAEAEENIALESEQLVMELFKDSVSINKTPTTKEDFPRFFSELMSNRPDKKLFLSVDDEVIYEEVIYWMSLAKKNGASLVALQMRPPEGLVEPAGAAPVNSKTR